MIFFGDALGLRQARPFGELRLAAIAREHTRLAAAKAHGVRGAVAVDLDVEPYRQRVDDARPDAVQAAGRRVGTATEFAAGMQLGHDDFDAGELGLRLDVDRNAAAVVAHLDRPVVAHHDLDRVPWPPSASSTELSMISHTQCIKPRLSVEPMYMPGRLRTASRPSSTSRWRAV